MKHNTYPTLDTACINDADATRYNALLAEAVAQGIVSPDHRPAALTRYVATEGAPTWTIKH